MGGGGSRITVCYGNLGHTIEIEPEKEPIFGRNVLTTY